MSWEGHCTDTRPFRGKSSAGCMQPEVHCGVQESQDFDPTRTGADAEQYEMPSLLAASRRCVPSSRPRRRPNRRRAQSAWRAPRHRVWKPSRCWLSMAIDRDYAANFHFGCRQERAARRTRRSKPNRLILPRLMSEMRAWVTPNSLPSPFWVLLEASSQVASPCKSSERISISAA
jgi:hypothetical protein